MSEQKEQDHFINQIISGDCREVLKSLPRDCVDMTMTSPPYGELRNYKSYPKLDVSLMSTQLLRVTKIGGVVVWVVGDSTVNGSETGDSFKQALTFMENGWLLHDTMIYAKNSFSYPSTGKRYHQCFEYVFIFSKGQPKTFNPIKDKLNTTLGHRGGGDTKRKKDGSLVRGKRSGFELNKFGMRTNVWTYNTGGGQSASNPIAHLHPAIFPEKLAMDHIRSWSNEGDLVLDPMAGSFTTCAMAFRLNRKFTGIDVSKEYCEIGRRRLAGETKIKSEQIF